MNGVDGKGWRPAAGVAGSSDPVPLDDFNTLVQDSPNKRAQLATEQK